MTKTQKYSRRRLASLITRSIFITISVLTVIVLLQNYQVNQQVVAQEAARSKLQTSSLVQQIFNYRLQSLEIQQDSYSRNLSLTSALMSLNASDIDAFFNGVDQVSPAVTPDFRFIIDDEELLWEDANAQFYGIEPQALLEIGHNMSMGTNWHVEEVSSMMGPRYLLLRRTPVIDLDSGEVLGYIHIGLVLNSNFSLVSSLLKGANVDHILLAAKSNIIAATTKTDDFRHLKWLDEYASVLKNHEYMVSRTDLTINGNPTFLSVYTIQNNAHIVTMMRSHYMWVIIALVCILLIALFSRHWLGQRVSKELLRLTKYTTVAAEKQKDSEFCGSSIEEFHQIGESFQTAFQRLKEQEKLFVDLFNYSLSPITLWDNKGKLIEMNPAAERSFKTGNLDDNGFSILVEKLIPQIHMCAHGATITGVTIPIGETTYRWNLSPIIIDNEIRNIIAQGQDVTSFIEAQRQSALAREEAEESARVRADFLAKMSHELRTPLNGILGISQLLRDKMVDPNTKEHIDILCHSGEHLLAVLNDILDFSKIEQGKFQIQCADFNLTELVTTVDKIYRPLCDEKSVALDVVSKLDDPFIVFSDLVRINQILFNLVSNAVKFTSKGQVRVVIECIEEPDGNDATLHIAVKDSGIGIDYSRQETIFEPFVQAESTTTREYGGSGLGLAIVKSLVDLMNGHISLQSRPGHGATFDVLIPVEVKPDKQTSNSYNLVSDPALMFDDELQVLLVEDNHTNAFIAKAFCEKYGMKVHWVQDGYNAIDFLKRDTHIDLILMDNQLPQLGGIETTKIIREDLGLSVPIYACTADGMQDTKRAFLAVGADYVLVKPIKEVALNQAFVHYKHTFLSSENRAH
ncbi:ATP-binding protein [Vibrio sp. AK197]